MTIAQQSAMPRRSGRTPAPTSLQLAPRRRPGITLAKIAALTTATALALAIAAAAAGIALVTVATYAVS